MAIVGCGRKKKSMLELRSEVTYRPCNVAVYRVPLSACWSRVVSLIQNQKAARSEGPKPVMERRRVGFVNQQTMRNQEARVRTPRVDTKTALPPNFLNVVFIQDFEAKAKSGIQFFLPLKKH